MGVATMLAATSCAPAPAAGPVVAPSASTTSATASPLPSTKSIPTSTAASTSSSAEPAATAATTATTAAAATAITTAQPTVNQINRDHYYYIRNIHKRPMRNGPRAGWDLVVRKADSCLLVIAQHRDKHRRSAKEKPVGASNRFSNDAETLKVVRERLSGDGLSVAAVAKIMGNLDRCPLGHRTLVSIKRKQP